MQNSMSPEYCSTKKACPNCFLARNILNADENGKNIFTCPECGDTTLYSERKDNYQNSGKSMYRIVPTAFCSNGMVDVQMWDDVTGNYKYTSSHKNEAEAEAFIEVLKNCD